MNLGTSKRKPVTPPAPITASEALYAFCGWLSTRDKPTVMGNKDACQPIADRIKQFINAYELPLPRDGWEKLLVEIKEREQ